MTNEIAPPKEIPISERIEEIEKFLGEEEMKLTTTAIPIPTVGIEPLIVEPPVYPEFSPTAANAEMIDLLRQIVKNQEMERRSWERSNPLISDSPVYDYLELSLPPGYLATFTLTVSEGFKFFFNYFNITYRDDSVYNLTVDGVTEPPTTEPIMDWADHYNSVFVPPKICHSHVIITALNNGDKTVTFGCFIRGFFRQAVLVSKEYLGSR